MGGAAALLTMWLGGCAGQTEPWQARVGTSGHAQQVALDVTAILEGMRAARLQVYEEYGAPDAEIRVLRPGSGH